MRPVLLVAFIGPSGVGKTSFSKRLINAYGFIRAHIAHTRKPRTDDDDCYTSLTLDEFRTQERMGAFVEVDIYNNAYYGTYRKYLEESLLRTDIPGIILDLSPHGCQQVAKQLPQLIPIKLLPGNPSLLTAQIRMRGSSEEETHARSLLLKSFLKDMETCNGFSVVVDSSSTGWNESFKTILSILQIET